MFPPEREQQRITRRMKLLQTHRAEVSLCAWSRLCAWICLGLTLFRFRRAAADPGGDAAGTGRFSVGSPEGFTRYKHTERVRAGG